VEEEGISEGNAEEEEVSLRFLREEEEAREGADDAAEDKEITGTG
jgi:hypothetical protein